MKPKTQTQADRKLRHDVISQLDYEPFINSNEIGVGVSEGIVTLTGFVDSFAQKIAAENAVKRVYGVRAVANDIHVKLLADVTDPDIARNIAKALEMNASVPEGKIKISVKDGRVTLTGEVEWAFQKFSAEKAIKYIKGVTGIANNIVIGTKVSTPEVKAKIEAALLRNAELDARRIKVEIDGQVVKLTGNVHSWSEREAVEYAALAAPGVSKVINDINIVP